MRALLFVALTLPAWAQTNAPLSLSLEEAERIAVQNSPRLDAARLRAEAAAQQPVQLRAAWQPQATVSLTGAGATNDSRIAAGALNNPVIFSRLASGVNVSQLLFDFGRTAQLVNSAESRASAAAALSNATRADLLLRVHRAYLLALRSREIGKVARKTLQARQLLTDQVQALADAKLKSGLDLSFAQVALAEAKLLVESAENDRLSADAQLAAAIGLPAVTSFDLQPVSPPAVLDLDLTELTRAAIARRPDIDARRLESQAARELADAERRLKFPAISAAASAGAIPARVDGLRRAEYVAGGINIALPFLNGGSFKAREVEARLRARAADKELDDLRLETGRAVRTAVLSVTNAFARLELTRQLLEHAERALDLARARYDLGLSSIVELSQAELARTTAELQSASARFDYYLQRSLLRYETGDLR